MKYFLWIKQKAETGRQKNAGPMWGELWHCWQMVISWIRGATGYTSIPYQWNIFNFLMFKCHSRSQAPFGYRRSIYGSNYHIFANKILKTLLLTDRSENIVFLILTWRHSFSRCFTFIYSMSNSDQRDTWNKCTWSYFAY